VFRGSSTPEASCNVKYGGTCPVSCHVFCAPPIFGGVGANPLQEWGRGMHRERHPAEAALEERLYDSKDRLWIEVNLWFPKNTEFTVLRLDEVHC